MKLENQPSLLSLVIVFVLPLGVYIFFVLIAGTINAQNTMNWCQYKNGKDPAFYTKSEATGKRWSPNVFTVGLTGECINPGDKGL